MHLARLIDDYCLVWSEPDADRRSALLSQVWSPQGVYVDPTVQACGAAELLEHIANVMMRRPGSQVVRTSAIDHHHHVLRFAWKALDPHGQTIREGIDLVTLADGGKGIEQVVGFFGPLGPKAE